MSRVNKRAQPTWDDTSNRIRGTKLKSNAWESVVAVFWFLVGIIGTFCNFIIKNKKSILDFCYNVGTVSAMVYAYLKPSKGGTKTFKPKARSKK